MKKFIYNLSRFAMMFAVVAMVACNNDPVTNDPEPKPEPKPEPEPTPELEFKMEAELVKAGTSTAELKLTTLNIGQYAYSVDEAGANNQELTPDIIFALGTSYECKDGDNTVVIEGLAPGKSYVVTFAGATVEDEFYEKTAKVELTTGQFTDELTIFDVNYNSFSMHFNFPTDKVQPGNVVKWGLAMFPIYYESRLVKGFTDAEMINNNDEFYHNYFTESATMVFNEQNGYIDEESSYYEPIVPGQPMYLTLGEFAYDTNDHWGWGSGYYSALFDFDNYVNDYYTTGKMPDDAKYWYGYNRKEFIMSKEPSKMSAKPEVTLNLTPMGGKVTIDLPDGVYGACVGMMDTATMLDILPFLNNNREYLQWYITSYHAFMTGLAFTIFSDSTVQLEELFYMRQKTNYTLYITTLGDELGSKQSFKTVEFTLPQPTKPAPKATVTGIVNPETNVNEHDFVWFNLKSASTDIIAAKYLANYEREWAAMQSQVMKSLNLTETEAIDYMIQTYGTKLSAEELAAIQLAEGWNVNFTTRPDAATICGLSVMNDEGTWGSAIDIFRSAKEPAAAPVQSTLFEELKGEWTASTTIRYTHYHYCQNPDDATHRGDDVNCGNPDDNTENNYLITRDEPISSKVVIGEVGYEATLPEEVYQLFFDSSNLKTKEEVDAVYNQFKGAVDDFNTSVRNQNRILCQGFALEYDPDVVVCPVPEHTGAPDGKIPATYATPYELFIADGETYSAYNYESPIFDFGPKWYLEIGADGKVTAPFNTTYFAPMAQWFENVYQFIGACSRATAPFMRDSDGNIVNGHFPVEISADKNTITILPFKHTFSLTDENNVTKTYTEDFYPQIARDYNGQYQLYSTVVAPIVLTRNGAAAPAAVSAEAPAMPKEFKSIEEVVAPRQAPKSRTALPIVKSVNAPQLMKYHVLSAEEFKQNARELSEKRYGRK